PLGVWVSGVSDHSPDLERLRRHERVVRRALRSATPIPFRYGQHLNDTAEARRMLRERQVAFLSTFEKLANRVEMGLRATDRSRENILPVVAPPPGGRAARPTAPGKAYLEARRAAHDAAAAARSAVDALLDEVEVWFT